MTIDSRGATPPGVVPGASAHSQAATGAPMTTDARPDETRAGAAVEITDVTKTFGRGDTALLALDGVSLSVAPGQFVCLIGASGCGKSTLLSLVAGLDAPTSGVVNTGGQKVALMFQEPALFPWLTAAHNVEMPLRAAGMPKAQRRDRVAELLDLVQLGAFADKRPHELSGGMRQRAALARSLAQDADVLLMGEPFGALDAMNRDLLHEELGGAARGGRGHPPQQPRGPGHRRVRPAPPGAAPHRLPGGQRRGRRAHRPAP